MNATSRAILKTVLAADASLSAQDRAAAHRWIAGQPLGPAVNPFASSSPMLVTQKAAAEMLSLSRATVWRMTKNRLLHPVEILPGTWRYHAREISELALRGIGSGSKPPAERREMSAA